ncbi:MAG TPA: hypothetical protein VHB21_11375 [Minicystis sp.]|nr:hypothetical protein [Minicystis sp.]
MTRDEIRRLNLSKAIHDGVNGAARALSAIIVELRDEDTLNVAGVVRLSDDLRRLADVALAGAPAYVRPTLDEAIARATAAAESLNPTPAQAAGAELGDAKPKSTRRPRLRLVR